MNKLSRGSLAALFFCFAFFLTPAFAADPAHDPFYTEGHSLSKAPAPDSVYESVDPFSGYLTLVHTDLHLPGNGGLDVRIMRTYTSSIWGRRDTGYPGLVAYNERSPLGIGWSMHMGIVKNPYGLGSSNMILSGIPPDNPVVEMPDGSNHVLYVDGNDSTRKIGKDYWIYKSVGTGIWELTLSDGTVYTFENNTNAGYNTHDNVKVAQVTKIQNPARTSTISISYYKYTNGYSYLKTITDTIGRIVNFNYDYAANKLTSLTVDSRSIAYQYQTILTTNNGNQNFLNQVNLPAGAPWQYNYNTASNTYDLQSITYPYGGTISYVYGDVSFDTGAVAVPFRVVTQRTTGGRDIIGGISTYSYSNGGTSGDVTTVNGPGGLKEIYKFNGWGNCTTGSCNNIWKMGLPINKETYLNNGLFLTEAYTWNQGTQVSSNYIANGDWTGTGGWVYQHGISMPFLATKSITRDGKTYTTTYSSYDTYGDPGVISESGDTTRSNSISYWTNTSKNIVKHKPSSETVSGSFPGSFNTSYSYDTNGNRTQMNKYGVVTNYTYYTNGNLWTVQDANLRTTTYEWSTGNISKITNPIYSITRTINGNGTIASETNGRGSGYTTSYLYDGMLRPTSIDPPVGNTTTYTYPADNSYKRETRGSFYTQFNYDGFGRPSGSSDSRGITTDIAYKSYGSKDSTSSNIGDTTYYDYFGRATSIVHQDLNDITYAYSGSDITVTDEANKLTYLYYDAFGSPDDKMLTSVKDAINNTTTYSRNILGSLTGSTQGSVTRTFGYSAKNFLTSESNPETGNITFGRDNNGNMTSRSDIVGTVTYTYDQINRLTDINFGVESITYGYDNADNRTSMTSPGATASYVYDAANRMTSQTKTISGRAYTTGYGYDGNDNLTSLTYPTTLGVTYVVNTNNQVTSASGFGGSVTGIAYNTAGLPTGFSYSNGKNTVITYNTRNLTTQINAGTAYDASFVYDGTKGNLTSIIDNLPETQVLTHKIDPSKGSTQTTNYGYANSRMTSLSGSEIASYGYNGRGDMTTLTENSTTFTPSYDLLHNLKTYKQGSTTIASYGYDGDGMRVLKTAGGTTTVYHHDKSGKLLSETDTAGSRIADYVYVNGNMAAKVEAAGVSYYHTDPAGTPTAITNSAGALVWRAEYLPFGEEQLLVNTKVNDKMFVGKEKDEETGLYYFGARYMQDKNARFISVDPVGPVDGHGRTNEGMLANPQKLSRYAYALNNPYRYVDPEGKWPERIHNRIIEESFGDRAGGYKLPADVRTIFKLASAHVDSDQTLAGSPRHAMRAPNMTAGDAENKMNEFINQKVGEYKSWMSKDNPNNAFFALGEAMHAVMDSTSPSHEGFQVWQGIVPLLNSGIHATGESYISSSRMERTVNELRSFFNENK